MFPAVAEARLLRRHTGGTNRYSCAGMPERVERITKLI